MVFLRSASRRPEAPDTGFPYGLPLIRSWEQLDFPTPVTFLVGENGSGKSTVIEALAIAGRSVTVGTSGVDRDETLDHIRPFAKHLALTWSKRTHRGFFLRAEDFFGYARRLSQLRAEAETDRDAVDREYEGRSELARMLARGVHSKTMAELDRRYGDGLDAQSHGESFLKLFRARLVPEGLYLLDEPEAPLSPLRQLGFLSLVKEMVEQNCQFIIATHSPILLAYPDATIVCCDDGQFTVTPYDELEHVTLTRAILEAPERYMRAL